MVYSQWKQRLYAFLLRRVVGPYLSAASLRKLHESIEVVLQDGQFILKDVDLNASYLTEIISKRGDSYVTIATVRRARIRRLQITLTLEETQQSDGSENTTGKSRSTVAWRAMKLGQAIDSEGGSVMLLAHVEIEGFDIDLEPGHEFTPRPSPPKPEPSSPRETASSNVGMIASYVEAAMSSLRLSVQMKDVRVKLCSSATDSSSCNFVEFHLALAKYHDVDDGGTSEQRKRSNYRTAMHKMVDFSGITFRTGEQWPASKEEAARTPVAGEKAPCVIAKTEGSGQVSLRAIEYSTPSSFSEEEKISDATERGEAPRIQQDLEVSLNQRLQFSVDNESLQSLLDVSTSFLKHRESSEESNLEPSAVIESNIGGGRLDELGDSGGTDEDKEDLDAMAGIMKQYAEARQLAERNELRGGILIPTSAYEEGDFGDDSVSFDAFFDCNDHAFSLYQSRMEQSISASAILDDDQTDFVHTKLRFHLQQCGVKVAFPRSDAGSTTNDLGNWRQPADEYVLLTIGDISMNSSLSRKVSDISLNAVHLEIEDSCRSRQTNVSRQDRLPPPEIGSVLQFERGIGDGPEDGDALVTEAPCISIHVLSKHDTKSTSTAEFILEPLELTFSSGTLSNFLYLTSQLDVGEISDTSSSAVSESKGMEAKNPWRISASCPSVAIVLPLGSTTLEGAQCAEQYSELFDRCGCMLPNAPVSRRSCLGFAFDAISLLYESKALPVSDERTELLSSSAFAATTTLSCHRLLCFVTAPRLGTRGSTICMQRADVVASSGHAPLSLTHSSTRAVGGEFTGRSSFPTVPPLSSFKARQEDEDSDEEDAFFDEFGDSLAKSAITAARASDPQGIMLQESDQCISAIELYLPELVGDLTGDEAVSLLNVLLAELSITGERRTNDTGLHTGSSRNTGSRTTSIAMTIDQMTLTAHQQINGDNGKRNWYSHEIMAEGFKSHVILSDRSRVKTIRMLAHELNLFEGENQIIVARSISRTISETHKLVSLVRNLVQAHNIGSESVQSFRDRCDDVRRRTFQNSVSVASPILYRSQLFAPLSPESPSILVDVLRPNGDVDSGEWNAHFTVYNMTYRCDLESRWLFHLNELLSMKGPSFSSGESELESTETDITDPEPSLFKIFVSLADCNIDYTTLKKFTTESRTLVRLGDFRLSSNLLLPLGPRQACRVSLGDISILLGNRRYDHRFENSRLTRASTVLGKDQLLVTKKELAPDDVLRNMNLITMLTLDAVDMVVASSASNQDVEEKVADPLVTVGVTLGMLSLYGCKDSFACFTNTLSELQLYATALDEETIKAMKSRIPAVRVESDDTPSKLLNSSSLNEEANTTASVGSGVVTAGEEFSLGGDDWATVENEWSKTAALPSDEEQAARWYSLDETDESSSPPTDIHISAVHLDRNDEAEADHRAPPKLRIISNHFPMKPLSDPFRNAERSIAKYAGTSAPPKTQARILVRDAQLRCRFFDGYDWPTAKKRQYKQGADFVIEPVSQNKLDAKKEELTEQVGERMSDSSHANKLETKAKLLGDLLGGGAETDETTFASTPLPEERSAMLEDLAEQRRLSRRMNRFLQVSLSGLKVRLDTFSQSDDHRLASCIDVNMADFFVAETISTSKPVKLLGEWFNETEHPRDSNDGLIMMKMVTWHPKYCLTEDDEIENDVSHATLEVLPLRCNIDQRAVRFAIAFFAAEDGLAENSNHSWAVGLKEIPQPLFQSFKVKSCKLKVNYTPVKVNVEALREGCYVELINISPLVDMVITLQEVHIQDLVGFGPNVKELVGRWIEDVCATQMYKFLANARPFQPISSVGGSAANLVVVPWEAYKKGDKVGRAMRSGAASFAGSVAYETLNTSAKLTGLAAQALSSATPDRRSVEGSISSSFLPSRPNDTPRGIGDTANHALESLARGFETANYKIVIVPYREYRRSGTTGAVKSVMRGIPVAIAAPVGAATEALSYTLLGARNQVRPDKRKEEEASERGLRHDF